MLAAGITDGPDTVQPKIATRKRPPIQGPLFMEDPPEYLTRKFPFSFRTLMFYVITSHMLCRKEKRKWKFTAQIFGGVATVHRRTGPAAPPIVQ